MGRRTGKAAGQATKASTAPWTPAAPRYPHPATPIPHLAPKPPMWRTVANTWQSRPWRALDLVIWTCVVAWALMDIVTTVVGLASGAANEGNHVGAAAYGAGGAIGLLQLKLLVLLGITAVWIAVPWQWRPYVRAGTVAGGSLTFAAAAHNAWILLLVH